MIGNVGGPLGLRAEMTWAEFLLISTVPVGARTYHVSFVDGTGHEQWETMVGENFFEVEILSFAFVPSGADYSIFRIDRYGSCGSRYDVGIAYQGRFRHSLELPSDSDFCYPSPTDLARVHGVSVMIRDGSDEEV